MRISIISKSTGGLNAYRKAIILCVIAALIMGVFVGCEKKSASASARVPEVEVLSKQIKDLVKGLEYSDKVAQDFVQMVGGWKDKQGQPVLVVWKKKLAEAKGGYKRGEISKAQLAKVEENIARELSQRIQKEIGIDFSEKFFDLADVIKHKQAQCLSYSQLVYIVGNSVGLSVKTINVPELMTGELTGHIACIVSLIDDGTIMVDLTYRSISGSISKPFKVEEKFAKVGNYWELKDKENPLGIHRRIQIFDRNGLIAGIYTNQGNTYAKLGQLTRAISDLSKAIELNPKYAGAYTNRGTAYRRLGQLTKAISDHNKAIKLNPKFAEAYYNRGVAYASLGKPEEAQKDLLEAAKLNPALKPLVKRVSDHFKLGLKLD